MDRVFRYISSHHNMSIIATCQDVSQQLSKNLTNFFNVIVLFKTSNRNTIRTFSGRFLVDYYKMKKIMSSLDQYGCICIDKTYKSPLPYRKNMIEKIDISV